jgi:uncharacterized protein (TIGR03435 family)
MLQKYDDGVDCSFSNHPFLGELTARCWIERDLVAGSISLSSGAQNQNGQSTAETQVQVDSEATTFLETLKEQLGVRLKPERAPLDVLIIDHLELPSEN